MNSRKVKHAAINLAGSGLLAAGLLAVLTGTAQMARGDAVDLFVTPDGGGDCSQAAPCDLEAAASEATDGSTIYLAGGTYTGSGGAVVTITRSITLYGGWDGTTSTPPVCDPDVYPATIDGETARRGATIVGPATVTLEGLAISHGRTFSTSAGGWDGAGLYAQDAALTLRDTAFHGNLVDVHEVDDSRAYGGGVAVEGGSLVVEASIFRWNGARGKTSSYGGGLSAVWTPVTVTGSVFQDNDAWHASGLYFSGDGTSRILLRDTAFVDNGRGQSGGRGPGGYAGALRVAYGRAVIEENTFRGSRADNDYGAVYVSSSSLSFARNIITGTRCYRTSGLHLSGVSPFTVTNNIIAANLSTHPRLGQPAVRVSRGGGQFIHNTIAQNDSIYGLELDHGATVALTNTILVSHSVGITVPAGSVASLQGTLWGDDDWANGVDWDGDGEIFAGTVNVWGNPAFVKPEGGDYHIGPASAARDTGVNAGVTEDVDGDTRPQGNGYDIGADEAGERRDIYLPLVTRE